MQVDRALAEGHHDRVWARLHKRCEDRALLEKTDGGAADDQAGGVQGHGQVGQQVAVDSGGEADSHAAWGDWK